MAQPIEWPDDQQLQCIFMAHISRDLQPGKQLTLPALSSSSTWVLNKEFSE